MHRALLILAFCGVTVSLWAADPFVGTWKMDIVKSKLVPRTGPALKESILVIADKGTDRESYSKETLADDSTVLTKWTVPQQGGIVKFQQVPAGRGDSAVVTRIGGGEDYWTILEKGKQIEVGHWIVSQDGKTIRGTITGIDAKGKSYSELRLGSRQ